MSGRGPGWRILVAALATVTVTVLVLKVWRAYTPDEKPNLADVVAVALTGATVIAAVVAWVRRANGTAARIDADVEAAAEVLAGLVERQWRTEARHRLLDDPTPIPVRWRLTADASLMSHPGLITAGRDPGFTGRSDDVAALALAFRGLTRRRLVITGGPGTGKTTLAVQLLLQLLATRRSDLAGAAGEIVPVPVLLPVSGWDVDVHPRLQDWLAVRLLRDHPALAAPQLGPGSAAALAEGGHVLPVLDGLDEIPEHAAARLIDALNASLGARDQLVLTSRTAEFATAVRQAGRPLTAAAVISPRALTPDAAADYLTACLPASPPPVWREILTALRARALPGLTQLAATPLGLWLIRTVAIAPGADPSSLTGPLGGDTAALRAHLLDRLIPALIAARPPGAGPGDPFRPRRRLDPGATRRYLTYLARAFPPATGRDLAWWRIAGTVPRLQATVSTLGLTAGLANGVVVGVQSTPAAGLVVGLVLGPVMLLLARGAAGSLAAETPGYADLRLRGRTRLLLRSIRGRFWDGLMTGLWIMIGGVFASVVTSGLDDFTDLLLGSAVISLLAGFALTLAFGLIAWGEQPTLTSTSTPRSSWRADRGLVLLRVLASGVSAGLVFGFLVGFTSGWSDGLLTGLFAGLVLGVGSGLTMGTHRAWLICAVAVAQEALARRLPWRIMDFLDDAHRLGLLRAVGPVYQFRHAALHDHLAADGPPSAEAGPAVPGSADEPAAALEVVRTADDAQEVAPPGGRRPKE
ncbi:NACHT domain-containing protein [Nonomuraea sp. SMC257]|uniref:NACHT domain-containing protein n=1 Tax=Nonomuraea montanisoli TaxID=2741721 RepID=A0A7Y6I5D4_9ACTN|nr:NACHT domain-containing protein [Nonomuraea montanisoli]NUW32008.1 NACHT domain-containing protein [Nonomuraea montanisoli]